MTRLLAACVTWVLLHSVPALAEGEKIQVLAYAQPPFMELRHDRPAGLAIDILNMLFQRAEVDYSILFLPPKRAYVTALSEPNNCVLAIERSQAREALFQWVSPILITRHGFYSNQTDNYNIRTLNDAKPLVIGSYLGSGVGEYLEKLGFNVDLTSSNDLNIRKLQLKRVNLWASDTVSAAVIINQSNLPIKLEHVFLTTLRAMGCNLSTSPTLVERLQNELKSMYQDQSIRQLYRNYLGQDADWLSN
ncbi:ABC transporter substrate-binding protein [Hahella sp. HN01]|uniref:substrate-binding periplasmic protein n=1 Tax=Hahella sp. HN01 TaxID=2847262 RepID=UPI001C1EE9D4|nr:transporter substrate-binding domain-containing protein [Hahella sp. HN01]MBU6953769.1 transporter substrate-binding domain-containing protein [Hahella sp. HN01]